MLQDLAAAAWGIDRRNGARVLYVVAEKILSGRERLPAGWCVHGTTGYNFLNQLNGLFVASGQCAADAPRLRQAHGPDAEFRRSPLRDEAADHGHVDGQRAHRCSRTRSIASAKRNRKSRDFTLNSIRDMLVEVVACFPVYRTYVNDKGWTPDDRAVMERAIVRARRRNPAMDPSIFDFFREVMFPRDPDDVPVAGPDRREGYPPADADRERGAPAVCDEVPAVHRDRSRPRGSKTRRSIATICCCR